jgi:hypothetical protein
MFAAVLSVALAAVADAQTNLAFESEADSVRYRDGRFFELEGGVTLQRSDEAESEEAVSNMPLLPGDRVWTDGRGRAEILFADGEVFRMSERAKIDYLGRENDERLSFRLFAGSFHARIYRSEGRRGGFELRAPGGFLRTTAEVSFRVDVRSGEATVSVFEGALQAELRGERLTLRAGEQVTYSPEDGILGPRRIEYRPARGRGEASIDDGFGRWCDDRDATFSSARTRNAYLPDDLQVYGDELDRNGEWVYEPPVQTYVYVPRVDPYWSPYTHGRWAHTFYGWTWIPYESWGFVTSHYGRWGYSSRVGWHWIPRVGFRGAWVSWTAASWGNSRYVGWCATGWNGRPVVLPGSYRGRAVERNRGRDPRWSYVRANELSRPDIRRHVVDAPDGAVSPQSVWASHESPDRDGRAVARATGRSRGTRGVGSDGAAINLRPSPGDSAPELRADPMTTIPSTELRRRRGGDRTGYSETSRGDGEGPAAVEGALDRWNENSARARAPRRPASDSGQRPSDARPRADDETSSAPATSQPAGDEVLQRFFRSLQQPRRESASETGGDRPSGEPVPSAGVRRPRPGGEPSTYERSPRDSGSPSAGASRESGDARRPRGSSIFGSGGGSERERSRPQGEQGGEARPRERPRGDQGGGGQASGSQDRPRGADDRAVPRRPRPEGL